MNKDLSAQLADLYLKDPYYDKRFVLWRSSEEEEFLRAWISGSIAHEPAGLTPLSLDDAADVEALKSLLLQCGKCGSVSEKKIGIGDGSSGLMIILHAPRLIGKIERELFKKDSITMLKQIVASLNVTFKDCYITNMIKCEPGDGFIKPSEMLSNCISFLEKELYIVKPKIVLVMGEMQSISKMVNNSREIFWFTIEHPITMLNNPDLKRSAWETLKNIMVKMKELGLA